MELYEIGLRVFRSDLSLAGLAPTTIAVGRLFCRRRSTALLALTSEGRSPGHNGAVKQFLIFLLVLIGINVVLALVGSPLRISIIGSIVLSLIVGGIMTATNRSR